MLHKMVLKGIALDPTTNSPIVILKGEDDKSIIPIWIGIFEAHSIICELERIEPPRPMTHDLMKNILNKFEISIEKVIIDDLDNNTFFATIYMNQNEKEITIDSRPSDAIAIAVRANSPIYVSSLVLEKSAINLNDNQKSEDALKSILEQMSPEDFGKYEM